MSENSNRQNFIDLMKAVGMFLIIYGHIVGDPYNLYNILTQPVHTKQIGVAFFVFLTGWGLANDTRPPMRVVFNRIFPFYFYGIFFALLISLIFLFTKNDTNPTNYLPFIFGVNVFVNYFPANPTTWYIGTYLHILLFWFYFMQGKPVQKRHLVIAFIVENIVRSIFLAWQKDYTAYMLLPNWLTVFLLGMYFHKKGQVKTTPVVFVLIIAWVGLIIAGLWAANLVGFDESFPFRNMTADFPFPVPVESLLISATYIIHTVFFFEIARRLPGHSIVIFFAQATLITVIIHMPIIFELSQYFYGLFESADVARFYWIFVIYIGTAVISYLIQKIVDPKYFANLLWLQLEKLTDTLKSRYRL